MKSKNVVWAHKKFHKESSPLFRYLGGGEHFWLHDPWGNRFEIVPGHDWFSEKILPTGGVYGVVIGVSDAEKAKKLYADVMGVNEVISDHTGVFDDIPDSAVSGEHYRRIVLRKKARAVGAFSKLLGGIEIELVQALDRQPNKIFEGRHWGDAGFIHLCFDVLNMAELRKKCEQHGFPFTVDSGDTFDMGESGGHFTYCEDPDGTLIEMVETHKVPVLKKLGWYINLKKRGTHKTLPDWMVRMLSLSKV
jgi:catechol 2,3-dioxygenase-like lactoylglutathione lyase family enzyme